MADPYSPIDRTLTVSEANRLIHASVEELFCDLTIEGEVSGFRPSSTGHWYFSLKDDRACIDCSVFRSFAYSIEKPVNGDLVIARGSLSYYEKTGRLSFVIRAMMRKGDGLLQRQIEKLKAYYQSIGYFDPDKKRPIPDEIRTIAVVTSDKGAAIQDIINITGRRAPSVDLIVFPCPVQGEGAAAAIASRIRQAGNFLAGDVLIIGRGGGSAEDLSPFSDPEVIEAIHSSPIVTISAVGHEIDWPLSDYAADLRAPTPSAAAEIVTERIFRRRERLGSCISAMDDAMRTRLKDARTDLERCIMQSSVLEKRILIARSRIKDPSFMMHMLNARLSSSFQRAAISWDECVRSMDERIRKDSALIEAYGKDAFTSLTGKSSAWKHRLMEAGKECNSLVLARIDRARMRIERLEAECEALSPLAVLSRGYSITTLEDGTIIKGRDQAAAGARIYTRLRDGRIRSVIEEEMI